MKVTHLLVDLENIQPPAEDVRGWLANHGPAWIFHGVHQKKLLPPLRALGERLTLVPTSRPGKNSLDFHLVFYLGYLASRNNDCGFVILSDDRDYDPVIEHVRMLELDVDRRPSLGNGETSARSKKSSPAKNAMPAKQGKPGKKGKSAKKATQAKKTAKQPKKLARTKPAAAAPTAFEKLAMYLRAHPKNLPTKRKTLERHLPSMLGGTATSEELQPLISKLEREGIIKIKGEKIEYKKYQ
jgi:hypothetical protein